MSAVESGSAPMEICVSAPAQMGLGEIGDWAARMERLGVDVIHIPETIHDPFTIAAMALTHTTRVTVRTSMALAFPRSPMITAYAAWDLAKYSRAASSSGLPPRCEATSSAVSPARGQSRCHVFAITSSRCGQYSIRFRQARRSTTLGRFTDSIDCSPTSTPVRSTTPLRKSGPAG